MIAQRTGALILLYNNGKVLLQKRTDDAPTYPGYWGFFGGGVKPGESIQQALEREVKEELGYDLKNPVLLYDTEYLDEINNRRIHKYIFVEKYSEDTTLTQKEGQAMDWFEIEKLDNLDLKISPYNKKIFQEIKNKLIKISK